MAIFVLYITKAQHMKILSTTLFLFIIVISQAQYSTPGTGINWNMDSLVVHSNGAVTSLSSNNYEINEEIIIAESDVISEYSAESILIADNSQITVFGTLLINNPNSTLVSPLFIDTFFEGFRFESGSAGSFKNVNFQYGGGFKVLTGDFVMDSCSVSYFDYLITTGAAIEVSTGHPMISNSSFFSNARAGISSAANSQVGAVILNNTFQANNTSNSNRPQINMGPSGASDTTYITGNTIIGDPDLDQVGGIAFSSLIGVDGNVVIQNNTVYDNRYGIAVIGNGINAYIDNNLIYDNNTQGDPMLGGSGINLNSTSSSFANVFNNTISGNLWGITVQGNFEVMLGDIELLPGHNSFDNNVNDSGIYALYNNTANPISAYNNCWIASADITIEEAEEVIFHQNDDASLGLVSFDPMWNCGASIGIEENETLNMISLFPNPANTLITIESQSEIESISIYSLKGQLIRSQNIPLLVSVKLDISDLDKGFYIVEILSKKDTKHLKFVKE